jgi:hypothetical protein
VAFSDLPSDFGGYIDTVFDTRGRLPAEWMDKVRTVSISEWYYVKLNRVVVNLVLQVLSTD